MLLRLPATLAIACLLPAVVGCQGKQACNGVVECVSSQAEADRLNAGSQCPGYAYCPPQDGGIDATTDTGSNPDGTADSSDGAVECSSPLSNPGFSSLADLPIAQLCAQSWMGLRNVVQLAPCQGTIEVVDETGGDCSEFWLFDAATGALVATGNQCTGPISCTAAPGFKFPTGCTGTGSMDLCPEAGMGDGGAPCDAAGQCPLTCPTGQKVCFANDTCIPVGTCCQSGECTVTGEVCSAPGGSCACPAGEKVCAAISACIATAACCTSADCADAGQTCPTPGQPCQ